MFKIIKFCKNNNNNNNNNIIINLYRYYKTSNNKNQYQDKFENQFEDKYKSSKFGNNRNREYNNNNNNYNNNNRTRDNKSKFGKSNNNNNNSNNEIDMKKFNYRNEVLIKREHNLKEEALYGINPVWVAITSDNRNFHQLFITKSIYETLKSLGLSDNIRDDTDVKLRFKSNKNENNDNDNNEDNEDNEDNENEEDNDGNEIENLEEFNEEDKIKIKKSFNRYNDKKNIEAIKEIIEKAKELNIPIIAIKNNIMESFSKSKPHQGLILDCSPLTVLNIDFLKPYKVPSSTTITKTNNNTNNNNNNNSSSKYPLWIVLDELWDPVNVGAIIRSCAFFNVDGIVISDKCSNPITPTASKCSSGAVENYLIHKSESINGFLTSSKKNGWKIIGTSLDDKICENYDINDTKLDQPTILVIGNEGFGIHRSILNICDKTIKISGGNNKIDSLNVSVTTGILIHNLLNSNKI